VASSAVQQSPERRAETVSFMAGGGGGLKGCDVNDGSE
jgi:hypothetical protein